MSLHKQNILFEALCVLVYDHSHPEAVNKNEALKNKVITALNERREKLDLAEEWIGDYIKEVVYPQLGSSQ